MKYRAHGFAAWRKLAQVLLMLGVSACLPVAQAQDAGALKARHAELREQLEHNAFQRPITLQSSDHAGVLKGDIYALVEQPYARVGPPLHSSTQWCDILILHLNVKSCRSTTYKNSDALSLYVGRKFDQPLSDAYQVDFLYQVIASDHDYLQVGLNADEGPLGTSDYRIVLEVVALDAHRSFLHMAYSYRYGFAARIAMQGYLTTIGRNKVGFSIVGRDANQQAIYMGGMRGVIERNTMRYYLAIESYIGALSLPAPEQIERRLNDWYAGIERYPRQLHELERDEYLSMTRSEIRRQHTALQ